MSGPFRRRDIGAYVSEQVGDIPPGGLFFAPCRPVVLCREIDGFTALTFFFDGDETLCGTVWTRQRLGNVKRLARGPVVVRVTRVLPPVTGDGAASGIKETYRPVLGFVSRL
jgi:hypothetical protein